ncbi:hypothetical protein BVG16_07230 [Paenibacillus selenitireducens]|uniref:Uncharacterized protein n=1 Tax=Paenibacillus selenitireducens TaxID=1324314 RepID=A0A1T2XKW1_9BACL|nr:hypothetical protein [Paenibacillus selenitireducens]OPA80511.1 hypothetical protein BVG16_07230 [Paenibacillus selenitireducens]
MIIIKVISKTDFLNFMTIDIALGSACYMALRIKHTLGYELLGIVGSYVITEIGKRVMRSYPIWSKLHQIAYRIQPVRTVAPSK